MDMIRKSHRHLRRSFSRTRNEDELPAPRDPASMPPLLSPFTAMPLPSLVMGGPGISPTVHPRILSSLDSQLVSAGFVESSEREKLGNKEKIKEWIQEQVCTSERETERKEEGRRERQREQEREREGQRETES